MIEKYLQKQCEQYLELIGIEYLHLTTHITRRVGNRFLNFPIQRNKGFPDFAIFFNNAKTIFIELKTKTRLKKEQLEKKEMFESLGFDYFVVKKFEDFKNIIEVYK